MRRLGVEGDGQGDTHGHGGPNRAVLVYQVESYEYRRRHFGRADIGPGSFAENLTVDGLGDTDVCIGDRYRIGGAEFEVSQPRVTCFRAGLRIGEPELAALLVAHHRPGFYMRVITEGEVRAGDEIIQTAAGQERVSVAAVDALLYLPDPDVDTLRRAVRVPALSPGWQGSLRDLLDDAERPSPGWSGFRPLRVGVVAARRAAAGGAGVRRGDREAARGTPPRPGPHLAMFDESTASLLEFAEACRIRTRWQCRSGVCQTCRTPALSGEVDYAPAPLADPAPGTVLACCARPRSDVVLDM